MSKQTIFNIDALYANSIETKTRADYFMQYEYKKYFGHAHDERQKLKGYTKSEMIAKLKKGYAFYRYWQIGELPYDVKREDVMKIIHAGIAQLNDRLELFNINMSEIDN